MKKSDFIHKRCERCGQKFKIPNTNKSPARELLIEFTPCLWCGYVKDVIYKNHNSSGRCIVCCIPFCLVKHQGKGMCNRCYMNKLRHK